MCNKAFFQTIVHIVQGDINTFYERINWPNKFPLHHSIFYIQYGAYYTIQNI